MVKKRALNNSRSALAKRLKRRGLVGSIKGLETDYLMDLWERYKDVPPIKPQKMVEKEDNYDVVKRILDNFVASYKEYFIGWYRDAWRYLPELEYFWQRLDVDKLNNDKDFVPTEVVIVFIEPSDWTVNEHFRLPPEEMADYLKELFKKYLI